MHLGIVKEYYSRIDRSDLAWVLAQFSPDAVYERADASYYGLGEISRFYQTERRISGVHHLETLTADSTADLVIATGRFRGSGHLGDERDVGFADVWHFDADSLVRKRQTYLAAGSALVRD